MSRAQSRLAIFVWCFSFACGGRARFDDAPPSGGAGTGGAFGAGAGGSFAMAGALNGGGGAGASSGGAGAMSACPEGVPSATEIALTPRENQNLELLAFKLGGGVLVQTGQYDRVVRDVTAIRVQEPDLAAIDYYARFDGKTIELNVDPSTYEGMLAGTYHAWDCLNQRYVVKNVTSLTNSSGYYLDITLKGIYRTKFVASEYATLPGVIRADIGGVSGGDGPTICLTPEGSLYHYVIDRAGGDCPAGCTTHEYHHFTTTADGTLANLGTLAPDQVAIYASESACN